MSSSVAVLFQWDALVAACTSELIFIACQSCKENFFLSTQRLFVVMYLTFLSGGTSFYSEFVSDYWILIHYSLFIQFCWKWVRANHNLLSAFSIHYRATLIGHTNLGPFIATKCNWVPKLPPLSDLTDINCLSVGLHECYQGKTPRRQMSQVIQCYPF